MPPKYKNKNSKSEEPGESKNKNVAASASHDRRSKTPRKPYHEFTYDDITNMVNLDEKEYASGRFAKVYVGTFKYKEIAVKKYPSEFEEQAKNEIQAFSDLNGYPHIVPSMGFCRHTDIYLVMNFVPTDLEKRIDAGGIDWWDTLHILTQLARSIKALIENDYVVGDIKPDNVLIDNDNTVYLCDFGSAAKGGRHLPTINYQYAAKEVLKGKGDQSKGDIYSFGVILLRMVMKCNKFGDVDHTVTMEEEMKNTGEKSGKNRKKDKNASNKPNYHISIKARLITKDGKGKHVVHNELLDSGCDIEDAWIISNIGTSCTSDHVNQRPEIDEIIATLEHMQNKRMMKQLKM